jgi:ribonuclease BN (tRNA processing enzyme)
MAQEELDWANLDAVWISHFHLDHMGGLAPFLFATRNAPQTRPRTKPLFIYGPSGFKKLLTAIDESNHYRLLQQPFEINLIEVEPGTPFTILPDLSATTFSTPHTRESLALRLQHKNGTTLVYTSDTGYSEALVEFAHDATLLLMECSFYENKPVDKHLELADAMELARKCRPKKLVLSHLYFEWDGIDLAEKASQLWSGETIEAVDGLLIEI